MAEKYRWVVIPQDATTLEDCTFYEEGYKPSLKEMQDGVGGGRIENLPKSYWKMKGIKTIYVNEEGLWRDDFKPNFIVNQMLAGDSYVVASQYGLLNRDFGVHMTVVEKAFENMYMNAFGQGMKIIGPCVAQIKVSALKKAIDTLHITSDFVKRKFVYSQL